MDTPTYEVTVTIGGSGQTTTSKIGSVLPAEIITRQSGKLIITAVDSAGAAFDLSALGTMDLKAGVFDSAEASVTLGTGTISGAGNNIFTASWVRDTIPAGWSQFPRDKDGVVTIYIELQETGTADFFQWSTRLSVNDGSYTGSATVIPLGFIFYYNPTYEYSNTTTAADPGAGLFRADSTTLASITALYVNDFTQSNVDMQTYWQAAEVGTTIYIGNPNVKLEAACFTVSGTPTNGTDFTTIPVTFKSAGTSQFTNGSQFAFTTDALGLTNSFADGSSLNDDSGNELLEFGVVASAVNHLKDTNAATATNPKLSAVGDDTNISLELEAKGTGTIKANNTVQWAKGADVASTAALPILNDGNYFDVTGTTTITSINTVGVGTQVTLHFDGILTLTHHATDLILPGAANITTAAGDEFTFIEYASGDWRCVSYTLASGKSVVVDASVGVYRNIYIDAAAMVPRTTNGAEALTKEFATNDIMIDYLAFDSTTEEGVQFKMMLPDEWDLSTIKLKFYWDAAATASGTVIWGVRAGAYSDSDAIDAALGTQITVTDTLLTVGDVHISPATAAVTVGGTPALGDLIVFQIVATTGGTIAVDQFLMGVSIQYKELTTPPTIW